MPRHSGTMASPSLVGGGRFVHWRRVSISCAFLTKPINEPNTRAINVMYIRTRPTLYAQTNDIASGHRPAFFTCQMVRTAAAVYIFQRVVYGQRKPSTPSRFSSGGSVGWSSSVWLCSYMLNVGGRAEPTGGLRRSPVRVCVRSVRSLANNLPARSREVGHRSICVRPTSSVVRRLLFAESIIAAGARARRKDPDRKRRRGHAHFRPARPERAETAGVSHFAEAWRMRKLLSVCFGSSAAALMRYNIISRLSVFL